MSDQLRARGSFGFGLIAISAGSAEACQVAALTGPCEPLLALLSGPFFQFDEGALRPGSPRLEAFRCRFSDSWVAGEGPFDVFAARIQRDCRVIIGLGREGMVDRDGELLIGALRSRAERAGARLGEPRSAPGLYHPECDERMGCFRPLSPADQALWPWAAALAEAGALSQSAQCPPSPAADPSPARRIAL